MRFLVDLAWMEMHWCRDCVALNDMSSWRPCLSIGSRLNLGTWIAHLKMTSIDSTRTIYVYLGYGCVSFSIYNNICIATSASPIKPLPTTSLLKYRHDQVNYVSSLQHPHSLGRYSPHTRQRRWQMQSRDKEMRRRVFCLRMPEGRIFRAPRMEVDGELWPGRRWQLV